MIEIGSWARWPIPDGPPGTAGNAPHEQPVPGPHVGFCHSPWNPGVFCFFVAAKRTPGAVRPSARADIVMRTSVAVCNREAALGRSPALGATDPAGAVAQRGSVPGLDRRSCPWDPPSSQSGELPSARRLSMKPSPGSRRPRRRRTTARLSCRSGSAWGSRDPRGRPRVSGFEIWILGGQCECRATAADVLCPGAQCRVDRRGCPRFRAGQDSPGSIGPERPPEPRLAEMSLSAPWGVLRSAGPPITLYLPFFLDEDERPSSRNSRRRGDDR